VAPHVCHDRRAGEDRKDDGAANSNLRPPLSPCGALHGIRPRLAPHLPYAAAGVMPLEWVPRIHPVAVLSIDLLVVIDGWMQGGKVGHPRSDPLRQTDYIRGRR